jgi:hypothetical protein
MGEDMTNAWPGVSHIHLFCTVVYLLFTEMRDVGILYFCVLKLLWQEISGPIQGQSPPSFKHLKIIG